MPNKSCGNCKHCREVIPVNDPCNAVWVCFYDEEADSFDIILPSFEACEKWEEAEE